MRNSTDEFDAKWIVVGFTGHRALKEPDMVSGAINRELVKLHSGYGNLAIISSAASGSDTLFLAEAEKLGFPLQIVLPFPPDQFMKDFSNDEWARVTPLLDQAIHIQETVWTNRRDEAYFDAGVSTVDGCDILLAVWNEGSAAGRGGTGDVIAYAKHLGKPIIVINDSSGQSYWINQDKAPEKHYREGIKKALDISDIQSRLKEFDSVASSKAPTARNLSLAVILLHLIATTISIHAVIFIAVLPEISSYIATGLKILFLVIALWLSSRLHPIHHSWTEHRPKAEMLRLFLAIWPLKPSASALTSLSVRSQEALVRNLEIYWRSDKAGKVDSLADGKRYYLENRIIDQLDYFKNEHMKSSKRLKFSLIFASTATFLAITSGVFVLLLGLYENLADYHHDLIYFSVKALSVSLPLLSAALLTYALTLDLTRRSSRYQELINFLQTQITCVEAAVTWNGLWRSIFLIERQLSDEVQEWNTMTATLSKAH
ncbi:MAG: hypothetical protein VR73_16035 [Gammaproteobacteria bacterium BRH_c0]|nr:MAG: hypothetical protein VR73_16035 [Gammaproteobacteria bacterium BRH_c0]